MCLRGIKPRHHQMVWNDSGVDVCRTYRREDTVSRSFQMGSFIGKTSYQCSLGGEEQKQEGGYTYRREDTVSRSFQMGSG
jgi:hypothetical protein